mmetsp:Transcript_2333/g.4900  ORF Transcript_2333/g.4900 Transcript_2333/m.4900 type:complete len:198 (+) Transcript_2333:114-707(+)
MAPVAGAVHEVPEPVKPANVIVGQSDTEKSSRVLQLETEVEFLEQGLAEVQHVADCTYAENTELRNRLSDLQQIARELLDRSTLSQPARAEVGKLLDMAVDIMVDPDDTSNDAVAKKALESHAFSQKARHCLRIIEEFSPQDGSSSARRRKSMSDPEHEPPPRSDTQSGEQLMLEDIEGTLVRRFKYVVSDLCTGWW